MNLAHWIPFRSPSAAAVALLAVAGSAAPSRAAADREGSLSDFHLQWSWSVFGEGIGSRGLEVIDLDGDGRGEILASSRTGSWYVTREAGSSFEHVWSSLPSRDELRGIDAFDQGSLTRVVVATSAQVRVYDGATRQILHDFPIATAELQALHAADLDGDSTVELLACDDDALYLYDLATGAPLAVRYGFGCRDLDVGQFDSDPQLEIALAGNPTGGYVLDGVGLGVDWGDLRGFGNRVVLADLGGDATEEVVSTIGNWQGLRAQDPDGAGTLWERPDVEVTAILEAEVDAAPGPEIVWGEGQWGALHVLAGATGAELWAVDNPEHGVLGIAAGDPDGDGELELVWGAGDGSGPSFLYAASTSTHALEATSANLLGPLPGFAVADLDGDGGLELATATATSGAFSGSGSLLVFAFADGELLRMSSQEWPGVFDSQIVRFAAAQLDADPALELCVLGPYGALGCYDGTDFAQQWRIELPEPGYTLAVAELDGDAWPELLVGAGEGHVYAFAAESGWLYWRTPTAPDPIDPYTRLQVADLEPDGAPEVFAGFGYPNLYVGWLTTFAGASGTPLYGPWQDPPLTSMIVAELDGNPGAEVVVGQADGNVVAVDPTTGVAGPPIATFPERVEALARNDVIRDGVLDYVAVGGGQVHVWDGNLGAVVWSSPFLGLAAGLEESLLVGDLDSDQTAEIVVNTGHGLALFEAPLRPVFADGFESGDTSAWSAAVP